jgi:hypothetical protein|tara:strand:- start:1168 stop:1296 length:129 start_codon:yes stop_codon:yes gene_type:complete
MEYSNQMLAIEVLSDLQDRLMQKYREEDKEVKVKKVKKKSKK